MAKVTVVYEVTVEKFKEVEVPDELIENAKALRDKRFEDCFIYTEEAYEEWNKVLDDIEDHIDFSAINKSEDGYVDFLGIQDENDDWLASW